MAIPYRVSRAGIATLGLGASFLLLTALPSWAHEAHSPQEEREQMQAMRAV